MTWDVLVLYIGFASAFCHDIEVEMDMIWKQLVCSIYLEGFIMGNKEKKKEAKRRKPNNSMLHY